MAEARGHEAGLTGQLAATSTEAASLRSQVEALTREAHAKAQACVDLEKRLAVEEERVKGTNEALGTARGQLTAAVRCAGLEGVWCVCVCGWFAL